MVEEGYNSDYLQPIDTSYMYIHRDSNIMNPQTACRIPIEIIINNRVIQLVGIVDTGSTHCMINRKLIKDTEYVKSKVIYEAKMMNGRSIIINKQLLDDSKIKFL